MKPHTAKPFWLWLNLLSLDAPLVALAWQDLLARCYPSVLSSPARLALGLSVWAIYLADRLVDTRGPTAVYKTARHQFHRQNHAPVLILLMAVLAADGITAVSQLPPDLLLRGFVVIAAVVFYLTVFAWWRIGGTAWKQLCAAIIFTAGIFISARAISARAADARLLLWPAAAFCALCLGNLRLIETWEQDCESGKKPISMAALSLLCAVLGQSRWYAAVALSAAGLVVLDRAGRQISGNARRVLADAVLLTPLLLR